MIVNDRGAGTNRVSAGDIPVGADQPVSDIPHTVFPAALRIGIRGTKKGILRNVYVFVFNYYSRQIIATPETGVIDTGNAFRNDDAGQAGAAQKRTVFDMNQAFGEGDAGQVGTVFKGRLTNNANAVGNGVSACSGHGIA